MLKRTSSEGSLYFNSWFWSLNNNKTRSSSGSAISLSSPPALFMQSSQDESRIVQNPNPLKSSLSNRHLLQQWNWSTMAMADKESSPLIFSHFSANPHLLLVIFWPQIEYATPSWVLSPYHHVQSIGKSHQEFITHHPLIDRNCPLQLLVHVKPIPGIQSEYLCPLHH